MKWKSDGTTKWDEKRQTREMENWNCLGWQDWEIKRCISLGAAAVWLTLSTDVACTFGIPLSTIWERSYSPKLKRLQILSGGHWSEREREPVCVGRTICIRVHKVQCDTQIQLEMQWQVGRRGRAQREKSYWIFLKVGLAERASGRTMSLVHL